MGAPGAPPGPPAPAAPPPESEADGPGAAELRLIADEPTNTLLITTSAAMWAALQPVLKRLDKKPRRVLIEILVAEILLDDSTSLGIEWALRSGSGIQLGGERLTVGSALDVGVPGIQPIPPGLFFILQSADILALIQAFSQDSRVNILSNPHVLTSEGKRAQIHVGRSVPILTTQQQPTTGVAGGVPSSVITTTVEYRDTGIILSVTPRIGEDRFIALDIRQEVSDAVPNLVSQTQSPVFTKRVAETSVVVAESETLILGGLIEERRGQERQGIPFLSRIPILGYLFGATTDTVRKTELLILVTPRVVADGGAEPLTQEWQRRAPGLRREMQRGGAPSRPPRRLLPPPAPPSAPSPQGFLGGEPMAAPGR
jgi:general secretion pathway protein D